MATAPRLQKHIEKGCAWFGAHNPERLGALVLMNPPRIFMALWSFILFFLDPDSAKRILVTWGVWRRVLMATRQQELAFFPPSSSPSCSKGFSSSSTTFSSSRTTEPLLLRAVCLGVPQRGRGGGLPRGQLFPRHGPVAP